MGRAECGHEVVGLAAQPELVLAEVPHGLRQRAVCLLARALERADLRLHLPERLAQRRDVRIELRLREIEERAGALLHRRRRRALDRARDPLVERPSLGRELRLRLNCAPLELTRLRVERGDARRGIPAGRGDRPKRAADDQPVAERPEREPDRETDEKRGDRHEGQGP